MAAFIHSDTYHALCLRMDVLAQVFHWSYRNTMREENGLAMLRHVIEVSECHRHAPAFLGALTTAHRKPDHNFSASVSMASTISHSNFKILAQSGGGMLRPLRLGTPWTEVLLAPVRRAFTSVTMLHGNVHHHNTHLYRFRLLPCVCSLSASPSRSLLLHSLQLGW
jgi:hypothetical protein